MLLPKGNWIADEKTDCKIWNPVPASDESIVWSGECKDGKAKGDGILKIGSPQDVVSNFGAIFSLQEKASLLKTINRNKTQLPFLLPDELTSKVMPRHLHLRSMRVFRQFFLNPCQSQAISRSCSSLIRQKTTSHRTPESNGFFKKCADFFWNIFIFFIY